MDLQGLGYLTINNFSQIIFLIWLFLYWESQKYKIASIGLRNDWQGLEQVQPKVNGPSNQVLLKEFFDLSICFMSLSKFQNGRQGAQYDWQGLERGLPLSFWPFRPDIRPPKNASNTTPLLVPKTWQLLFCNLKLFWSKSKNLIQRAQLVNNYLTFKECKWIWFQNSLHS